MTDNLNESMRHIGKEYGVMKENRKCRVLKLTPLMCERIKEIYATTKTSLIAQELGVSYSAVARNAHRMGLRKDEEFIRTLQHARGQRCREIRQARHIKPSPSSSWFVKGQSYKERYGEDADKRRRERAKEGLRDIFRKERARAAYGLPQRTRLRVVKQPKAKANLKWFLKKRGYILDCDNGIAYYDENTNRAMKTEKRKQPWFIFQNRITN